MADEIVTIDVEIENIKADTGALNTQIEQIENDFSGESGIFSGFMPGAKEMFAPFVKDIRSQFSELMTTLGEDDISAAMVSGMRSSMGFLNANIENIRSSAAELGEVFRSIPAEMQSDFSRTFMDIRRQADQTLNEINTRKGSTPRSIESFAMSLQNNPVMQPALAGVSSKFHLTPEQTDSLMKGIVRQSVPSFYNADLFERAVGASKGSMKYANVIPEVTNFRERLPERYRDLSLTGEPTSNEKLSSAMYEGRLSYEEYNKVKAIAAKNKTFERALIETGLAVRGQGYDKDRNMPVAGVLSMPEQPITRLQYAQAMGHMFSSGLIPALEGAPAYYSDWIGLRN